MYQARTAVTLFRAGRRTRKIQDPRVVPRMFLCIP